mgnify:CR=1 FL=1
MADSLIYEENHRCNQALAIEGAIAKLEFLSAAVEAAYARPEEFPRDPGFGISLFLNDIINHLKWSMSPPVQ